MEITRPGDIDNRECSQQPCLQFIPRYLSHEERERERGAKISKGGKKLSRWKKKSGFLLFVHSSHRGKVSFLKVLITSIVKVAVRLPPRPSSCRVFSPPFNPAGLLSRKQPDTSDFCFSLSRGGSNASRRLRRLRRLLYSTRAPQTILFEPFFFFFFFFPFQLFDEEITRVRIRNSFEREKVLVSRLLACEITRE